MGDLPVPGGDPNSWGTKLNTFLTDIPVGSITGALEEYAPLQNVAVPVSGGGGSMLIWDAAGHPIVGDTWANAQSYGYSTDNSGSANKAAIDAAIADLPDMGKLYIPRGRGYCENLAPLTKSITIVGDGGFRFLAQREFGHTNYDNASYVKGGSILAPISTSGVFIDAASAIRYLGSVSLEHIGIVGAGDATRTIKAVAAGGGISGIASLHGTWLDVGIANMAMGFEGKSLQHYHIAQVGVYGCKRALVWSDGSNANQIDTILVAQCGAAGVNIMDFIEGAADGVHNNVFSNLTLQTNYAGTCLHLGFGAQDNEFRSIYSENPSVFGLGIDYAIDVDVGADTNLFSRIHAGLAMDRIRVRGADNTFMPTKYTRGDITDTGNGNKWEFFMIPQGGFSTKYPGLVKMPRSPKIVAPANSPYTPTVADDVLICDTSTGNITVTLPPAATQVGKRIAIKKVSPSNSLVIDADGAELIDSTTLYTITASAEGRELVCDGARWWTVARTA